MKVNPKDWNEDFEHENGNYFNKCCHCKCDFIGHKRRVICKECYSASKPEANPEGENKPEKDYKELFEIVSKGYNDGLERERKLMEENKTLRQQLEYYADKNQNQ